METEGEGCRQTQTQGKEKESLQKVLTLSQGYFIIESCIHFVASPIRLPMTVISFRL
jgi:hypothetical protein